MIETARFGLINRWKNGDWNRTKAKTVRFAYVVKFLRVSQKMTVTFLNQFRLEHQTAKTQRFLLSGYDGSRILKNMDFGTKIA
jgi:hypothetical protein